MIDEGLYDSSDRRMDTVGSFTQSGVRTWQAIKRAHAAFMQEFLVPDVSITEADHAFGEHLKDDYGIELTMGDGGYSKYQIVDQQKYLVFVLKFVK